MQRTIKGLKHRKNTPQNSPQSQSRNCMIWTSIRFSSKKFVSSLFCCHSLKRRTIIYQKKVSFCFPGSFCMFFILFSNSQHFSNWCYKITSTIPKLHKKAKNIEKFRSEKNQIQSHFYIFIFISSFFFSFFFESIKKNNTAKET